MKGFIVASLIQMIVVGVIAWIGLQAVISQAKKVPGAWPVVVELKKLVLTLFRLAWWFVRLAASVVRQLYRRLAARYCTWMANRHCLPNSPEQRWLRERAIQYRRQTRWLPRW